MTVLLGNKRKTKHFFFFRRNYCITAAKIFSATKTIMLSPANMSSYGMHLQGLLTGAQFSV